MTTPPTVVLVHGVLTDASVWHGVIRELHEQGLAVLAPSLPTRSLEGDIAYLRSVLETIEGPVVVAGHSYGGSVISSPDALTSNVAALVFVAAFVQDAGETPGELNGRYPGSRLTPENLVVRPHPGGQEVYLDPSKFAEVYASDVEPQQVRAIAASQHPFDPTTLGGHFEGIPTWRSLPSWAVVSTQDVSIPTEALRFMAERAGSTIVDVAASHGVPLSQPKSVADVIATAVASI